MPPGRDRTRHKADLNTCLLIHIQGATCIVLRYILFSKDASQHLNALSGLHVHTTNMQEARIACRCSQTYYPCVWLPSIAHKCLQAPHIHAYNMPYIQSYTHKTNGVRSFLVIVDALPMYAHTHTLKIHTNRRKMTDACL